MADINVAIALSASDRASADITKVAQALGGLGDAASQASSPLKAFNDQIVGGMGLAVGTKLMEGFAVAIGAVGDSVIGMNAKLEQSTVAFTTLFTQAAKTRGSLDAVAEGTQKAQAFLGQLQEFAAKTPFEFKELVPLAQRLQSAGFAAEQVIPLLRDVGNAASASGQGAVGVDRISFALGQMNTATKVNANDMHQLTDANVPAWRLLAEAIGKTEGETMKLVETGKVGSDVFIAAFHEWSQANVGNMMEEQAKTFLGAMSTIQDVIGQTTSRAFLPFFQMVTQGAQLLGAFLQEEGFQTWAVGFANIMQSGMKGLQEFGALFAPFGEAVRKAFTSITETGNVSEALAILQQEFGTAFEGLLGQAKTFATNMLGSGMAAITSYAQGMLTAINGVLTNVVNTGAQVIASFFIGHSPPPAGPLSEIETGGQRLMETYGEGMMTGMGPARAAARAVAAALDEAGGNMGQLKTLGGQVETQMKLIAVAGHDIDAAMNDTKQTIAAVKAGYAEQLAPLEAAHQALQGQHDTTQQLAKLGDDLTRNLTEQAALQAKGDQDARAQLMTQQQLATIAGEEARLGVALLENQEKINKLDEEDNRYQEAKNKLVTDELALQEKLAKALVPDPRFAEQLEGAQRKLSELQQSSERFGAREATLEAQRQKLQTGGGGPAEQALAAYRTSRQNQQLAEQLSSARTPQARSAALQSIQEATLTRAAAEERRQAELKANQVALEALAKEKAATEEKRRQEIADAERRITAIQAEAAKAEIERGKAAEAARAGLLALDERATKLDAAHTLEQATAGFRRDALLATQAELTARQGLNDLIDTGQRAEAIEQTNINKLHDEAAKLVQAQYDTEKKMLDVPLVAAIAAIKAEQKAVLEPLEDQLARLAEQKTALGEQKAAWGEVKAGIAAAAAEAKQMAEEVKAAQASAPRAGLGIAPEEIVTPEAKQKAEAAGALFAASFQQGMNTWLGEHTGQMIGGILGGVIGAIAFGPIGAAAGAALGQAIGDQLQATFATQNLNFGEVLQQRFGEAVETLEGLFHGLQQVWGDLVTALTDIGVFNDLWDIWNKLANEVGPNLAALLDGMAPLMRVLADVAGTALVLAIKAAVLAFELAVTVIADVVTGLRLLGDVYNILGQTFDHVTGIIVERWAPAWVDLTTAVQGFTTFLSETALPAFTGFFTNATAQWTQFITDVAGLIGRGIEQWGTLFQTGFGPIGTNLVAQLTGVGTSIIQGLQKGITDAWAGLLGVVGVLTQALPDEVKKILQIGSPSLVFAEIGTDMVGGIAVGWEQSMQEVFLPMIDRTLEAVFGKATEQAKAGVTALQGLLGGLAPGAVGGQAYPGGGLGAGTTTPPGSTAALPGRGGTTQGTGAIGGSSTGSQFGLTEFVAGTGSAYPGSGMSAWRQNAPPVGYIDMYKGTAPYNTSGVYPGSTIAQREVPAPTPGPTGTSGPSYGPDAALIARFGSLLNATIAMGIKTPEQSYAEGMREEHERLVQSEIYGDARAVQAGESRVVINQTNNVYGTDPASFATAADRWIDRAQWQAGLT